MNRSCISGLWAIALLGWVAACRADYINHTFDAAPFTNGATFTAPVLQWQATTESVVVANTKAASPPQSVYVPGGAAISNAVAVTNPSVVWTDIHVAPCLGEDPDLSVTNGVATVQYFGTNGYLNVWTNGGWLACSNDVWGQPVIQVTNGVFVDLAIYQNFTSRKAAILLNDQVVIQDLPLLGSSGNYNAFQMGQAYGDAWLDDAAIQPTYDPVRLTHNLNGIDGADASELQTYGYVARTLYVGTGPGYPGFSTIQAALNAWRARDPLYVYAGQYAEDVTLSNSVTFGGQAFTNSGTLTIKADASPVLQSGMVWGSVNIDTNSTYTFSQSLSCSNLVVRSGATVTLQAVTCSNLIVETGASLTCSGNSLTVGSAVVSGAVYVIGGGTATVTTALSLPVGGHMDFTQSRLLYTPLSVNLFGTFSISNNWGVGGVVSVSANANCIFDQPLVCGGLVVASGATVTLNQGATLTSLNASGTVFVGSGNTLTVTTATVSGAGSLAFTGGHWVSSGVDMTGTFSITNTWGTQATATLDFSDTFELYATDSQMANLGFRGWGASSAGVLVKAGLGVGGSQGVLVPEDTALSNRIASVGQPKIWTDYYLQPSLGEAPTGLDTNRYTSLSFVDTNGFLNVWNAGTWAVCSNYVDGSAVPTMTTNAYSRVTLFLNFGSHLSAFFVGGKLVFEKVPFPAGAAIPSYSSFRAESQRGNTYLDNVSIATNLPADLLSVDSDNDGIPDVLEIQNHDSLRVMPVGTVFKFR